MLPPLGPSSKLKVELIRTEGKQLKWDNEATTSELLPRNINLEGMGISDIASWNGASDPQSCICFSFKFDFTPTRTKAIVKFSFENNPSWIAISEDLRLGSRDYQPERSTCRQSSGGSSPAVAKKRKLEDGTVELPADELTDPFARLMIEERQMYLDHGITVPYPPLHQILTSTIERHQIIEFFHNSLRDAHRRDFYCQQLGRLQETTFNLQIKNLIFILQVMVAEMTIENARHTAPVSPESSDDAVN